MRLLVLLVALGLAIHFRMEIASQLETWAAPPVDPHVAAAIDLRCDSEPVPLRDDCARELEQDFVSGLREPETIVRRHCTRLPNDWMLESEPPLPICRELYGGWIRG
jgi:hypothetical protein